MIINKSYFGWPLFLLLAACGGEGAVAVFFYIAPIGGNFVSIGRDPALAADFSENNSVGRKTPSGLTIFSGLTGFPLPVACEEALNNDTLETFVEIIIFEFT